MNETYVLNKLNELKSRADKSLTRVSLLKTELELNSFSKSCNAKFTQLQDDIFNKDIQINKTSEENERLKKLLNENKLAYDNKCKEVIILSGTIEDFKLRNERLNYDLENKQEIINKLHLANNSKSLIKEVMKENIKFIKEI